MCFNISLQLKKARMEERFNAVYPDDLPYEEKFHASAFDRPGHPVLTSSQPGRFQIMTWGLIPSWIKSEKDAYEISLKTMNARFESITEKPSFRQVAKTNRCIIPVTGFFEWQQVDNKKIPWFITVNNDDAFSLAGLWSEWSNHQNGEIVRTFTIITTEATGLMAEIHNTKKRMPAILTPDGEKDWLNPVITTSDYSSVIKPINDNLLKAYTISPLISNSRQNRNVPEVLLPYSYNSTNLNAQFQ